MANEPSENPSASSSLLEEVAKRYATAEPVREKVVKAMADEEIEARAVALRKVLVRRSELQRDLKKVDKPDIETFNADRSPARQEYSKAKLDEIHKAKEALDKVEKALDLALTKNDFSKVKEIAGKAGGGGSE